MDLWGWSRPLELLGRMPPLVLAVWLGLAAITVAVLVMRHTRWGQAHPLRKCLLLSLLAHLLLGGYATTIPICFSLPEGTQETTVLVSLGEEEATEGDTTLLASEPSEAPVPQTVPKAAPPVEEAPRLAAPEEFATAPAEGEAVPQQLPETAAAAAEPLPPVGNPVPNPVPALYRLRTAPDRAAQGREHGATAESEQAVQAALDWLARRQSPHGLWIAQQFGAGQETRVLGRDRQGAGAGADCGVSGLALLAFLAAGHTPQHGDYRDTVRRGLDALRDQQAADGYLGGPAGDFAGLYCHGMATLALSEAAAMTGDPRLHETVQRAIGYTLSMQNPNTGGWRYRRGDDGDTSQLGWQLMTLKSAELLGIAVPEQAWQGAERFLRSVSSGRAGGLAAYRPGQRPSQAMTAEALLCRQLLGQSPTSPAAQEAAERLLEELPGDAEPANLYYWYYGTLGLYPLQDPRWLRWNAALQRTLLARQCRSGPEAGSWDTNTLWGGYGGRVYTTAMAALSLEIYYRYLPLLGRGPAAPHL